MNKTISGAITQGLGGPGNDDNEEVFRIPQSSNITGALLSGCLALYIQDIRYGSIAPLQRCNRCILLPRTTGLRWSSVISGNSLGKSYPSAEMQSTRLKHLKMNQISTLNNPSGVDMPS